MSLRGIMTAVACGCLLTSCMTATPSLHVVNGETRMTLTQSAPISRGADCSPDGKALVTGGLKGFAHWDISRGLLVNRCEAELPQIMGTYLTTGLIPVAFVSGGRQVLSGGEEVKLWDLASGKVIRTIGKNSANSISVSADGKRVLTCEESEWSFKEDKLIVHDVQSGRKIAEWNAANSGGIIALSPDGQYALSTGGGERKSVSSDRGIIHFWEVATGRHLRTFAGTGRNQGLGSAVLALAFSQDGKYALSGGTDGSLRLWDLFSGRELKMLQGHTGWVGTKAVAFSPDGRWLLSVGGSDGLAKLWDRASGTLIRAFPVSDDRFVGIRRFGGMVNGWVSFTPDSRLIIFMGSDASFRLFETATGKEVATLILFDDGEWLVVTSEGYYNASAKGAQYLNVRYEGRDYTVDQFYDVFYRPDIVAAKLSGQDIGGLVSLTMREASQNPPPVVEFTKTPGETKEGKCEVCYRVKSAGGGIGEVRLFHNGKLIQSDGHYRELARPSAGTLSLASLDGRAIYADMRSIQVKGVGDRPVISQRKEDLYEACTIVETIPGDNEISLAAFNAGNSVQSAMKTVNVQSRIATEEPHLYMLLVGIDQYRDGKDNLKYAAKDATDMRNRLVRQSGTLYRPDHIHTELLTNQEATREKILGAVERISRTIRPGDGFIFFAAGHGVLLQNQYYLLTHDFAGTVNEQTALGSNGVIDLSKRIKSLSQLFIFDTCHAGGVDSVVSGLYDARMSVLAKKMGLHIYASASDRQAAMDGYQGNGLFTHTVLNGLNNNREADKNRDGKVTVVGLGEYARKATSQVSQQIGHQQTPLIIHFGKDHALYRLR